MLNIIRNKIFNKLSQEQIVLGNLVYTPVLCTIEETSSSRAIDIPEFNEESFVTIIHNGVLLGHGIFSTHHRVTTLVNYSRRAPENYDTITTRKQRLI